MPRDAHSISVRTRSRIREVLRRNEVDPEIAAEYGMIDRIIRGQMLCEPDGKGKSKVRMGWNPSFSPDEEQFPVSVYVDSRSRDGQKYLVGVLMAKVPDDEVRILHTALAGRTVFEIRDVGGEVKYRKKSGTINIPAHTCEDGFYQRGLKDMPTPCMHQVAAAMFSYGVVAEQFEREDMVLLPRYLDVGRELIDFYKEAAGHDLRADQRLHLLYGFVRGRIGMYRTGKAFLKSVGAVLAEVS